MKKLFSLLFALLAVTAANAQILKGDMNGDGQITMADANEVTNTYLGKKAMEYISGAGDPFGVDNSRITGTWYKSKSQTVTFNADGTQTYLSGGYTYQFLPYQGQILFLDANGKEQQSLRVWMVTSDYIVLGNGTSSPVRYTKTQPVQLVTGINLSKSTLTLKPGAYEQVTATVLPTDADNSSVTWTSSNTSVATVMGGIILAVAEGTSTITCTANDGSGVKSTCTVTVSNSTYTAVDLGLSVKWATCNVGASKPEDYGDYFAWGETKGYNSSKKSFSWSTYKWCSNGTWTGMTKYTYPDNQTDGIWYSGSTFIGDRKTVLDKEDDAASVNWGGSWRMPTNAEQDELRNTSNCTWTWTDLNGVKGYKVTSKKNGNSIFLPAAGFRYDSSLYGAGSLGYYWSSSLNTSYSNYAFELYFYSNNFSSSSNGRYGGLSVRAVCP